PQPVTSITKIRFLTSTVRRGAFHVASVRAVLRGGGACRIDRRVQPDVGVEAGHERARQAGGGLQGEAGGHGQADRRPAGPGGEGDRRREGETGGEVQGGDREAGGSQQEVRRAEGRRGRQAQGGGEGHQRRVRGAEEGRGVSITTRRLASP